MTKWADTAGLLGLKIPKQRHTIEGHGDIWIYGLTVGQKDEYEDAVYSVVAGSRQVRIKNARALLIMRCCYDQHGKRLFGDAQLGKVSEMPAALVEPIYDTARKLSGMPVGEIEDLVKNSEAIAALDSGTGSPATSE